MLILTRRQGEILRIGDTIAIQVIGISGDQVRLGFAAPKEVKVWRQEVYVRLKAEGERCLVRRKQAPQKE